MSKYKYIFFDLDGTLTDPGIGITNAIAYSLEKFNITPPPRQELFCFIGPPLLESYVKYYSFSEEQAKKAITYYREYYSVTGVFENRLYDGMDSMLSRLKNAELRLMVASSKPYVFVKQVIDHFSLSKYFDYLGGATLDGSLLNKWDVIEHVISSCNIPQAERSSILMVGDRHHDIDGAKKCGLDSMGVLFGYGSRQEHEQAGADYIAETVEDIYSIIVSA